MCVFRLGEIFEHRRTGAHIPQPKVSGKGKIQ